jgi:hypothetical protein
LKPVLKSSQNTSLVFPKKMLQEKELKNHFQKKRGKKQRGPTGPCSLAETFFLSPSHLGLFPYRRSPPGEPIFVIFLVTVGQRIEALHVDHLMDGTAVPA